jgi:hypothetical protein
MATTLITDDETWDNAQKGVYNSYSVTAISKEVSDQLAAKGIMVPKERVTISSLKNPVGYTISLVPAGCVYDNDFLSMKSNSVDKAGRSISNATLSTLQKAYEKAQSGLDNLKDLLSNAKTERSDPLNDKGTVTDANKVNLEVDDMDEKQLAELISDKFDEKVKPITEELESIKTELNKEPTPEAVKCLKCEHELGEADKFCPKCGDAIKSEESEPV